MSHPTDSSSRSFFAGGWRNYVPSVLQTSKGLLKYYLAVLPVVVPAAVLLVLGGDYAEYGMYLTVGVFVAVSAAYTVWLVRKLRRDARQHDDARSPGARSDRPGQRSSSRGSGEREWVRREK